MHMLTKLAAGASIALAASLTPALADGLPKGHYAAKSGCASFAGFYVGVHAGSVTYDTAWTDRDNWADRFSVDIGLDHVARSQTDWGAGLQGGYNLQRGCTVIGFEADWTWTNAGDSRSYTGNGNPADLVINLRDDVNWFGTLRARSGIVVDNLLIYATGGLAFADVKHSWQVIDATFGTESFSANDTKWGWTAGVGTEWAWSDRVTVKTEALYIKFDDESTTVFSPRAGRNVNFDHQDSMWVGRIGLNIKFGDRGVVHERLK